MEELAWKSGMSSDEEKFYTQLLSLNKETKATKEMLQNL
jgi:hypothetical protein